MNDVVGSWTAHSFIILDGQTASDGKTCVLCSDVPDFLERHRVVLKTLRSIFKPVLEEAMCYETFSHRPSESGMGALGANEVLLELDTYPSYTVLSAQPPLAFSSPEERRQTISFGLVNNAMPPGRRFWERYVQENEQWDKEARATSEK